VAWFVAVLALVFALISLCNANGVFISAPNVGKTIGNVTHGLGTKGVEALETPYNESLKPEDVNKVTAGAEADLRDAVTAQELAQRRLAQAATALFASPFVTFAALWLRDTFGSK
jgi:hypothetical protein